MAQCYKRICTRFEHYHSTQVYVPGYNKYHYVSSDVLTAVSAGIWRHVVRRNFPFLSRRRQETCCFFRFFVIQFTCKLQDIYLILFSLMFGRFYVIQITCTLIRCHYLKFVCLARKQIFCAFTEDIVLNRVAYGGCSVQPPPPPALFRTYSLRSSHSLSDWRHRAIERPAPRLG
jgi:hypothetical protein